MASGECDCEGGEWRVASGDWQLARMWDVAALRYLKRRELVESISGIPHMPHATGKSNDRPHVGVTVGWSLGQSLGQWSHCLNLDSWTLDCHLRSVESWTAGRLGLGLATGLPSAST